jgi:monothiol glutaredoxin
MTETTENALRDQIQQAIAENPVMLFMKGTPDQPMCGFSARTVAALQSLGRPFAAVNVLPDPRIREELSALSNWPTIPQLFVGGELVGGCDIVMEMYQSGELQQLLGVESSVAEEAAPEEVAPEEVAPEPAAPQAAPLSIENRL